MELSTNNSPFRLKDVSLSNFNKIRKLNFSEYNAKKPGDNFVRCSTCNRLHSLQKAVYWKSQATMLWARKLKLHLDSTWAHWELYYANHYHLQFFPSECVTIMHDKMDHPKTASLVFCTKRSNLMV
jgi:hypothetical protein